MNQLLYFTSIYIWKKNSVASDNSDSIDDKYT